MNIEINYPKVEHSTTSLDLPFFSDNTLGKERSLFEKRRGTDGRDEESLCGFYLPPFQRPEVWDMERKIRLIESLFCEISIGSLCYVSNYSCPQVDGWLIDGQQRLTAIRDFTLGKFAVFDNRLAFADMATTKLIFPGSERAEKEIVAKNIWRRTFVPCVKIQSVSDPNLLKELYERLNFGGVAHENEELKTLQEMRM